MLQLTVYYEDGSSGMIEIEKPPGAHPDSVMTKAAGLIEAEKCGKRVKKIGRSKVNPFSGPPGPLVIDDDLLTRDQVLKTLRLSQQPVEEKYRSLFG